MLFSTLNKFIKPLKGFFDQTNERDALIDDINTKIAEGEHGIVAESSVRSLLKYCLKYEEDKTARAALLKVPEKIYEHHGACKAAIFVMDMVSIAAGENGKIWKSNKYNELIRDFCSQFEEYFYQTLTEHSSVCENEEQQMHLLGPCLFACWVTAHYSKEFATASTSTLTKFLRNMGNQLPVDLQKEIKHFIEKNCGSHANPFNMSEFERS